MPRCIPSASRAGPQHHQRGQHAEEEEQVGFVELDEHAAEHARLLARGRAMLEAFASGQLHVGELFRFFSHDIVTRHLLGDDRRYFPRVTDQPCRRPSPFSASAPISGLSPERIAPTATRSGVET
jgi:hypothetical protein